MNAITFDTLKFTRKLKAGGFTAEQAEAAAEAFADAATDQLSTKYDIELLRKGMQQMEYRITTRLGVMIVSAVSILLALDKLL